MRYLGLILLFSGCAGGSLVTAPYRARESELGPALAEGRPSAVIERAGTFEKQNAKSRDVYWYKVWRAAGMIAMGQVDEGDVLLDSVLTEVSSPEVTVAEPQRLRMFAYDEKAIAANARGKPGDAMAHMERALQLAIEVNPSTGGACDRDLALAARHRQIQEAAALAGDGAKASRAEAEMGRRLSDWSLCLGKRDYPTMQALVALKGAIAAAPAVAIAVAPVAAAPVAPVAVTPKKVPPPVAPVVAPVATPAPAPVASGPVVLTTGLRTLSIRYAPVDPTPYKEPMESLLKLVDRQYKGAQADALIRVDGGRRALRVRFAVKKFEGVPALLPLFKKTVVFFERTREIEPRIEEVVVQVEAGDGSVQIVAQRGDVFDLFVDKIDNNGFIERLAEVR